MLYPVVSTPEVSVTVMFPFASIAQVPDILMVHYVYPAKVSPGTFMILRTPLVGTLFAKTTVKV